MRYRSRFSALVVALTAMAAEARSQCVQVFPKVQCIETIDANTTRVVFGVSNEESIPIGVGFSELIPEGPVFPPSVFPRGYTPNILEVIVDPSIVPQLIWKVACEEVIVDTANFPSSLVCSVKPGPAGPPGPQGPTGPPGPSNLSTCRTVVESSATPTATAACLANERVLAGGGSCSNPSSRRSAGLVRGSFPETLRSWRAECTAGRATAHAICCLE